MENIWGVLLQAATGSLCAIFLLILKGLLNDKLSPRWQYAIWSVLALRLVVPVRQSVLLPLPLWVEMAKGHVEQHLQSAWSSVYQPVRNSSILPHFEGLPHSVTDWLFVAYAFGVLFFLFRYLFSYIKLRLVLRTCAPASLSMERQIQAVADQYGFRTCRAVTVPGLQTAFVCGMLRPILAIPETEAVDDKVLLHELLHLQSLDAVQNLLWCVLRSLYWFDPILQAVFSRIGNDLESLCDQRVLERLDGEERRRYGNILLQMASDRYARAPGTTSISNGGKHIARRIQALVHFKLYPKGMALVSLCMILLLANSMLLGNFTLGEHDLVNPKRVSHLPASMAYARLTRCQTAEEALALYGESLLQENGVLMAMASPLSAHEDLEARMRKNAADGWVAYHLETYDGLECVDGSSTCTVDQMVPVDDNSFQAELTINVYGFLDEDGFLQQGGTVTIPVTVSLEDGWVVRETGPRIRKEASR